VKTQDRKQNSELTFKGNEGLSRHGWLRLTPAYGVRLVDAELAANPDAQRVLDPFSGTGTTGVSSAQVGRHCELLDLNPFLIWLARTKTRSYTANELSTATELMCSITDYARSNWQTDLWEPPIRNIDRWWSPSSRAALRALRAGCDKYDGAGHELDLVLVAFCQVIIDASSAAFNHVSMSFKDVKHDHVYAQVEGVELLIADFKARASHIIEQAFAPLLGSSTVHLADSRDVAAAISAPVDLLLTSPPYCNRMSYIRELRPYMYWLRFFEQSSDAGELDWQAIGGTWGTATSRLMTHTPADLPPLGTPFLDVLRSIASAHDQKNAQLLSNYVRKYFTDVWTHIQGAAIVVRPGGKVVYVVGNSTFFGNVVATEEYYATLLARAGFVDVEIERLRKRNSNKALYEYAVRAVRP
jgi:hypothetical protein